MPEFYMIIGRKKYFPEFGGGGAREGGRFPSPVSYAYVLGRMSVRYHLG